MAALDPESGAGAEGEDRGRREREGRAMERGREGGREAGRGVGVGREGGRGRDDEGQGERGGGRQGSIESSTRHGSSPFLSSTWTCSTAEHNPAPAPAVPV